MPSGFAGISVIKQKYVLIKRFIDGSRKVRALEQKNTGVEKRAVSVAISHFDY